MKTVLNLLLIIYAINICEGQIENGDIGKSYYNWEKSLNFISWVAYLLYDGIMPFPNTTRNTENEYRRNPKLCFTK